VNGGLANVIVPAQKSFAPKPAAVTALLQNAPNPFRLATVIDFSLAGAARVQLEVFDPRGRRIATLADGDFEAGAHRVEWNGRTANGDRAPAGVYFYRLTAPGFRQTRKMIQLQ